MRSECAHLSCAANCRPPALGTKSSGAPADAAARGSTLIPNSWTSRPKCVIVQVWMYTRLRGKERASYVSGRRRRDGAATPPARWQADDHQRSGSAWPCTCQTGSFCAWTRKPRRCSGAPFKPSNRSVLLLSERGRQTPRCAAWDSTLPGARSCCRGLLIVHVGDSAGGPASVGGRLHDGRADDTYAQNAGRHRATVAQRDVTRPGLRHILTTRSTGPPTLGDGDRRGVRVSEVGGRQ